MKGIQPCSLRNMRTTILTLLLLISYTGNSIASKLAGTESSETLEHIGVSNTDNDIICKSIYKFLKGNRKAVRFSVKAKQDLSESTWPEVQCKYEGLDSPQTWKVSVKKIGPGQYKYSAVCPDHGDVFVDFTTIHARVTSGGVVEITRVIWDNASYSDDEDLRTPKADGYEDYVEPVVDVFTLLYATSSDGVVNVRSTPNAKGTKVGEIHDLSGGYGDGVFLKPGSWYKVIASNGKVGYANSKILAKQTWYNGGKKALVAKANCPVYSENYADGGIESGTPICRLSEGTIIADKYLEDEEGFLYILPTAHDNLYVPKRFCVLKNVY